MEEAPRFSDQPTAVKVAVGLTIYTSFVFFEELVVDRYGIWSHLPFYKFGKLCAWDLGAILTIGWFVATGALKHLRPGRTTPSVGHSLAVKLAVGLMWLNALVLGIGILDRYKVLPSVPAPILALPLLAIVAAMVGWVRARTTAGRRFGQQPVLLKVSTGFALWNLFFFLEYLVINPTGLSRYLPAYRAEGISVWDFSVPISIALMVWWNGFRRAPAHEAHA